MDWDKLKIFHCCRGYKFYKSFHYPKFEPIAISRQIQGLENDLKVQLFERHARGLVLTKMGNTSSSQPMKLSEVERC